MYTSTLALLLLAAVRNVAAYNCQTHTYGTCQDNIVHWYDPDDGMICDPLDCGGGRAPPKTDVPCCAAYKGTQACVTTPSYMPCFHKAAATSMAPAPTTSAVVVEPSTSLAVVPPATTTAAPVQTTAIAPAQTTPSSTQVQSAAPATTTISTVTTSKSSTTAVVSSSAAALITSKTTQVSSSSTTSAAVISTPINAAAFLQSDAWMAIFGLAVGLVAAV